MTSELPETITISKTLPSRIGGAVAGGDNGLDEQGRWMVRLSLSDAAGERHVSLNQGDAFEFAGATWEVTKIYEPNTATRGSVATLTRVAASGG